MEISAKEYTSFKEVLEKQSGILLGENKQYLVVSRLSTLAKEQGVASIGALIDNAVRPGGSSLLKKIIDRMTTNETLWFRDRFPFDYLKSTIVPELRKKSSNFRIWCAACSTGQEPYSIAIMLDEMNALSCAEIVASDLSERVLEKAKLGIYQQIELNRGMPVDKLHRHFSKHGDNEWQISSKLRNKIRFNTLNLLNLPYSQGKFDVIYCRNVLIYFSGENKTKVINGLINQLKPGGYLFLGASEALSRNANSMTMIRCNPGLVYRKD